MGQDKTYEDMLKEAHEEVMKKRMKALDNSARLYDVCRDDCNMLPEGWSKDRQSPICDACPINKGLIKARKTLDNTLDDMRRLRR